LVAVVVLFAVVLPYYLSPRIGVSYIVPMRFTVQRIDGNWSVRIDELYHWNGREPPSVALTEATITVRDINSTIRQPMSHVPLSNLTESNWHIYKVYYQKKGSESDFVVGASILLDMNAYPRGPRGYSFVLESRLGILGECDLQ